MLNSVGFLYAEVIRYLNLKVSLDQTKHVIVITGCDSGFGDLSSRRLTSLGFQVVSGCVTAEGAERLKGKVSSHWFVFPSESHELVAPGCLINHL